jgi:hypothetical protein
VYGNEEETQRVVWMRDYSEKAWSMADLEDYNYAVEELYSKSDVYI